VLRSPGVVDLVAILGLGFILGIRHATDPDHVVAVTAIVSRERSVRSAVAIGVSWGLGHAVTVLLAGGAIVLFGIVVPPRVGLSMEMAVAALLVVLGAANLTGALESIHRHAHSGALESIHRHAHSGALGSIHRRAHSGALGRARAAARAEPGGSLRWFGRGQTLRPLLVGLVHGLAGSAAISLLVLATIHDAKWALVYLLVFAVGTVLGMVLLTLGMAGPIVKAAGFSASAERALVRGTGLLSLAFGLFMAYRVGVADGLLVGAPHWSPR